MCMCNFACKQEEIAPRRVCVNVDRDGRFSPGLAAVFFEYSPPADQTLLYLVCFSKSSFQSAALSVPASPLVFRLGFTG